MRKVARQVTRVALTAVSPLAFCAFASSVHAQAVVTGSPGGALTAGTVSTSNGTASDNGPGGVFVAPGANGVVTVTDAVVNQFTNAPALTVAPTAGGVRVNFTGVNTLQSDGGIVIGSPGTVTVNTGAGNRFTAERGTALSVNTNLALTLTNGANTIIGSAGGILATSANGAVSIQTAGSVLGRQGDGVAVSTPSHISITNSGSVTGTGAGASGIRATATSGSINVTNTGAVTGTTNGMTLATNTGSVDVVTSGSVVGQQGVGISSVAGALNIIRVTGAVTGGTTGIVASAGANGATTLIIEGSVSGATAGITAQAGAFGVGVNVTGSVTSTGGPAITATSGATASVTVGPNGLVAGVANPGQAVINMNTAQGSTSSITIAAGGVVRSTSSSTTDAVLKGSGGSFVVNNSGAMTGRLDFSSLTGANNVRVNAAAGSSFQTGGVSTFSAGNDVFVNAGTVTTNGASTTFDFRGGANTYINNGATILNSGPGATAATLTLTGLTTLNNGGLLQMANGVAGDSIVATGAAYRGDFPGRLSVDTFIGGPGSLSDTLVIGTSTGRTSLLIHDVSNDPGALNTDGTVIVAGSTHTGDFVLDPASSHYNPNLFGGAIDKPGLFFSQLAVNGSGATVLISAPKSEAYQLATLGAQGQKIWHDVLTTPERQAYLRQELGRSGRGSDTVAWFDLRSISSSRDSEQSLTVLDRVYTYDAGYSQDIQAAVAGLERTQPLQDGGWAVGASLGYVTSDADFDSLGTTTRLTGPVGDIYATAVSGGKFVAASISGNLLDARINAPQLAGLAGQDSQLTSWGGTLEAGVRLPFLYGSQLEPSAMLAYVSTSVDDFPASSNLRFEDAESLRVGVGVRMSGAGQTDASARYSLSARFVEDLSGDNTTLLGNSMAIVDGPEGGFGEVRASIRSESRNGWAAFGDAAVQSGSTLASSLTVGVSLRY